MHPLSWFTDRIGKTIKRTAYDTRTDKTAISRQHITDQKKAQYLHDIQSKHITFEDNTPGRNATV